MKNTIVIIISVLFATYTCAQELFEKSIAIDKSAMVELDFQFADQIIIKTWDKNEASVKAIVNINDNSDNDKFSLEVTESGNEIAFKSDIEELEKLSGQNSHYQQGIIVREDDYCVHLEIDFEVWLPATVQLKLKTISGNIEITGLDAPMEINTISGFIDVTISETANADITMKTITGDFYSNLDLLKDEQTGWKNQFAGGKIKASLNDGGNRLFMETISGNIYLRRK